MKRRFGIRAKLAATYLIIAVPLMAVIAASFAVGYQQTRDRVLQEQVQSARLAATLFDLFVEDIVHGLEPVGRAIAAAPESGATAESGLAEFAKDHPVTVVAHVDRDLRVMHATDPDLEGFDMRDSPALRAVAAGRQSAIEPITTFRGVRGFWAASAIGEGDERLTGYSATFIDLSRLPEGVALERIPATANVVDPNGVFAIVTGKPELAGTAGWRSREPVEAALAGRVGVARDFDGMSGEPETLVEVPIPEWGWAAGSSVPNSESLGPVRRVFGETVLASLAVLAAALTGGLFLARGLADSVDALAGQSRRMGGGDLDEPIAVETGDEVSDVADALEETRRRLKSYIVSLSEVAEVGRVLTSSLRTEDVKRTIEDGARRLFGARAVWVFLAETGGRLTPFLLAGDAAAPLAEADAAHEGVQQRALREARIQIVHGPPAGLAEGTQAQEPPGTGPFAIAPLLAAEEPFGVLGLSAPEVATWVEDGREAKLLGVFASLVANALYNAALFGETEDARSRAQELAEEARRHAREMDAVVKAAGDPLIVIGPDDVVRHANPAAVGALGFEPVGRSRRDVLGRLHVRTSDGEEVPLERVTDVLMEGEGEGRERRLRVDTAIGRERIVDVTTALLAQPTGTPAAVVSWHDVTEIERARELGEWLARIDRELGAKLTVGEALGAVCALSSEALGSRVTAVLLKHAGAWHVEQAAGLTRDERGRLQDAVSLDPASIGLASGVRDPLLTNDARATPAPPYPAYSFDPRLADVLALDRVLVAPVLVQSEIVGAALWGRRCEDPPFDQGHADFGRKLARSLALAIETRRVVEAERDVSRILQEGLLRMPERLPGVRFGHLYRSATEVARVGGDFYDLFELDGDRTGILIGDVSGKGIIAAGLTSFVKDTTRAYAYEGCSPREIATRVNEAVFRLSDTAAFVTVFFAVLDNASGMLTFCPAGHPPALVRRGDGPTYFLACDSPMIGAFSGLAYGEHEQLLDRGDVLLLYTDGVTEAKCTDGTRIGEDRLLTMVRDLDGSAEQLPARLYEAVEACAGGRSSDDIAILAVQLAEDHRYGVPIASATARTQPGASAAYTASMDRA